MTGGPDSSMQRGAMIIDALIDAGMREIVVAPGSRSAPLALAAAAAERAGRVGLHVRIDERSAGFLALGLAKGSGAPVAVITTSGTAAVNLHPAVVEASYGGVPLIAVTADRPERLRGVGANQTIVQQDLFGGECRYAIDLTVADTALDASAVMQAIAAATDPQHPGPVHLNVALDEPLVDSEFTLIPSDSHHNRDSDAQGVGDQEAAGDGGVMAARGLVLVGDTGGFPESIADPVRIAALAAQAGWPIISEPSGNASDLAEALRHGPLIAGDADFVAEHTPQVVVTIGRVGLHRSTLGLLKRSGVHIAVDPRPVGYACDPLRTADRILDRLPDAEVSADSEWLRAWRDADRRWAQHIDGVWGGEVDALDGVGIAREVVATVDSSDTLVIGPSWPARHVSAYAGPIPARVLAHRGTSGIDGIISSAWGVACVSEGFTVALLGDLTAIYDRNGLLAAPGERHPHLAYVVVDNDGGGIFGELEQGAPEFAADFERVFGTPHGARLGSLLDAPGITLHEVTDAPGLRAALDTARAEPGVHLVIATTTSRADQVARFRQVARAARGRG